MVFLARRPGGELCALKVLLGHADEEAHKRFELEAAIARRLEHPAIARVLDVGRAGEHRYYAMEHCPGSTLRQRLKLERLRPRETAQLIAALAGAMAYAHAQGVVHRDLKPANVILSPRGPRITDFGLARDRSLAESLTRTGDVLGTPNYMSPEQFRGEKTVGPAADVWGLGVIFYQCLTGELPFKADTPLHMAGQVQQVEPERPRRLQPDVPPELEALCLRCLHKVAQSRPSAAELAAGLADWLRPSDPAHSPSGVGRAGGGGGRAARGGVGDRGASGRAGAHEAGAGGSTAPPLRVAAAGVAALALILGGVLLLPLGGEASGGRPVDAAGGRPGHGAATPSDDGPPGSSDGAGADASGDSSPAWSRPPPAASDVDVILRAVRERARGGASLDDTLARLAALEVELSEAPELAERDALDRVRLARAEVEPLRARGGELGLHADYVRGWALLLLEPPRGVEAFGALYRRDPEHPVGLNGGALHGFFTAGPGSYDLARRCFEARPDYVPGRLSWAYALYERGRAEEALAVLEPLAEPERDNPRYHVIVGYVNSRRDPDASLRGWERALELTAPQGFARGLENVVAACLGRGELERALAPLELRLSAAPDDAFALSWRGLVVVLGGDVARARADWERAVALDPRTLRGFVRMQLPPRANELLRAVLESRR